MESRPNEKTLKLDSDSPPIEESREDRPWGHFFVLDEGEQWKTKTIVVQPGQKLSLQSHEKRDEIWYVTKGVGVLSTGQSVDNLGTRAISFRSYCVIPRGTIHRVENIHTHIPLEILETQVGVCEEEDIKRYEDDYGRV